jgi:Cation transporter/ATPase, N-terminus
LLLAYHGNPMAEPALDSNRELRGLSPAEVSQRREQYGVNEPGIGCAA